MNAKRLPVLVIEDEPSVIAFITAALERNGYEVAPVSSGADALLLLARGQYMGVISDIRTPGGVNVGDVHDWISRHRRDLLPRMIFITGDTASEETARLLKKTGTPCLEKPFRVQDLIAMVEQVFGEKT